MARADRTAVVEELAKLFEASSATVLTEYRGLTVAQLQTLRRSLGPDTTYAVVKNTLTKRAAAKAGVEGWDDQLVGPSAIAFVRGDPVDAAKGLRAFAKDHEALVIKAGYMDGRALSAAEVARLADLESREVLLAKLAGAMKASLSQAAALFNAPLSQAARAIEALRVKASQDPTILAGGSGATEATPVSNAAPEADEETPEAAQPPTHNSGETSQESTEG